MTIDGPAETKAPKAEEHEAAANKLSEGIWVGTPGSPDLTPDGKPKPDAKNSDNRCDPGHPDTLGGGPNIKRTGITKEELAKDEQQIAQDKKPLVALRSFEPAIGPSGPWITERVYEYGKFSAMRVVGPSGWDSAFQVKVGDKQYFDIPGNGKNSVLGETNVRMEGHSVVWNGVDPLPLVKRDSQEYKAVLGKLHMIDFDHIPDYDYEGK